MGQFAKLLDIEDRITHTLSNLENYEPIKENPDFLQSVKKHAENTLNRIDRAFHTADDEDVVIAEDMGRLFLGYAGHIGISGMRNENRNTQKRRADINEKAAKTDELTDLPNRVVYTAHIEAVTKTLATQTPQADGKQHYFALVMFDLDRFKGLNDDHGHLAGDAGLKAFADKLKASTRVSTNQNPDNKTEAPNRTPDRRADSQGDHLFRTFGFREQHGGLNSLHRVGGDEFTLFMNTKASSPEEAQKRFESGLTRIRGEIAAISCEHDGKTFPIVSSAGMHIIDSNDTAQSAYEKADVALHKDKETKAQRYDFAVNSLIEAGVPNLQIIEDKRAADMKIDAVAKSMKAMQMDDNLSIHVKPGTDFPIALSTLEDMGVTIIYDDEPPAPDLSH